MAANVFLFTLLISLTAAALTGSWEPVNIDDDNLEDLVNNAVQELEDKSNSMFRNKLVKITNAQKQVVAGYNYDVTFDMGVSDCLKGDVTKDLVKDCSVREVQECTVQIWTRPWLDSQKMTGFSCSKKSSEEEETNDISQDRGVLKQLFQQARGNVDMIMNQIPAMPVVDPEPPKIQKPLMGGDDHDVGNYGEFQNFKIKHNKNYASKEEEQKHFKIFRTNMKTAKKLQDLEKGSAQYGASVFADMDANEFRKFYLTPKWDLKQNDFLSEAKIPVTKAPDAFDWRDSNAVTPVKNQGSCGSCWAFSTTGNVEGQWAIKNKELVSLSEQELVDCDKLDEGCNGGLPTNAYQEIIRLGGLETESEYPYKAEGEKCVFQKKEAKVDITGALNISSNEEDMKKWLYKNGPISIGLNANAMQFYMGGVSHPWSIFCDPQSLDHGVLIVGYGTKQGWFSEEPYWIIKNSWGPSWGEKGYYLLYRGKGVCGVNQMPTSAVIN